MFPNLSMLALPPAEPIAVKRADKADSSEQKRPNARATIAKKTRKLFPRREADMEEQRNLLNEFYSPMLPVQLDVGYRELMNLSLLTFKARPSPMVFSSDSVMKAMRVPQEKQHYIDTLVQRWKPPKDDFIPTTYDTCGTSNCFKGNISIEGDDDWQVSLRILLALVYGENPKTVAIRAPVEPIDDFFASNYKQIGKNVIQRDDELALTLYLASVSITVPILMAFPFPLETEPDESDEDDVVALVPVPQALGTMHNGKWYIRDYAYVTEDGWTGLHKVLHDLFKKELADIVTDVQNIGAQTVELMELVAVNKVLLTDIKLKNMVAKQVPGTQTYAVKMIDFSPIFTTIFDVKLQESGSVSTTCVFFVNGLLLLSGVAAVDARRKEKKNKEKELKWVFRDLAMQVVQSWKSMTKDGSMHTFCAKLSEDERVLKDASVGDNLMRTEDEKFVEKARSAFYTTLWNYGQQGVLKQLSDVNVDVGFINKLVDRMASEYQVSTTADTTDAESADEEEA